MKILLVEDERLIAKAIEQVIKKNHYSIDLAFDGQEGIDNALTGIYDVIILDIMLPKKDGISVLKELRESSITTPVLMLTAKGEIKDKILGLDTGADDYLTKPFDMEELLARIRALLRRQPELINDNLVNFEDCTLLCEQLMLTCNNKSVKLTSKEAQILEMMILNNTRVLSKQIIIEKIWGYDTEAIEGNVETQVSLLRKKLREINSQVIIKAIRGTGYILRYEER
ncbi:MAG: response regulator transcription factor [Coprobacillaceae bacterium]